MSIDIASNNSTIGFLRSLYCHFAAHAGSRSSNDENSVVKCITHYENRFFAAYIWKRSGSGYKNKSYRQNFFAEVTKFVHRVDIKQSVRCFEKSDTNKHLKFSK